ncbi:MAG TPA: LAGLIDADG family homing endonuclease, partial [Bacteroidia bacterium]|nr:LAGLIDADG family homing endonuclease [Bacteroidia bacterium]
MPNGENRKGKFAIVELDQILASHNEKSYGNTAGYPLDANGENVNDRNYSGDASSQAKIREFAQNLEPDRLITTSRTPAGTPIISIDGIVVSGNNRTMSIKLAVSDFPEKYEEYKEFLAEEFDAFGFDENDKIGEHGIKYFTHPILVRIDYDFPAYNALELSKYNKDTKKSERPIDKALKLGKILESSEKCTSIISDIVGQYETFTEFYANRADQKKIKETLVDCNILTSQEMPAYYSETGFTEQGKELIENLLAGLVLSKDALIASNEGGARTFRQTILTSLPILTANKNLGAESLNDALNEAIVIQSQISSSKISFADFIAQNNIFGDRPSEKGMYLNRLLAGGRNNFKRAIEAYNDSVLSNQGESLFNEKPSPEEIFEAHIKNKIDPKEKGLIENSVGHKETPNETKKTIEPKPMTTNPFINGNFFKEKPENILATTSTSIDRWKKPITEYKGSLEDISRIEAPLNFLTATESNEPLISVIEESVFDSTESNTQVVDNLQKAVQVSQNEEPKKAGRKKKATQTPESAESLTESYSINEVYNMLNPEISLDELRAFMWWKHKEGRPIEGAAWMSLAGMTADELYNDEGLVREWVERGILYYFDGKLLPAYLYLAENVYDKKTRLVAVKETEEGQTAGSGQDAEYIINTYGKEVYENQIKALDEVFRMQYEKRLLISGPESDSSLIISPVSKFAKTKMIKTLVDEAPFKWKKITAGSNKNYGKPDFLETYVSDRDKHEFPELSLTDAFCYWLRTDDTIQYQKGMNYADIIKIYIQSKSKPATLASKDDTGHFTGEQLTIKKKEDAAWERLKSKAKTEGDRLFLVFLDKQLTANDKVKIESQWNRDYNGYVKINYNKVPVAFPCNRYDMGKPMEIKPEKREAVAFTFSEGSGLLAYDVGVGKANLLTSDILTPKGWVKMGDIKEGDLVIGKNGKPTKVEGVFPQGKRQSYKVTFSDGSYTEVTDEHLWNVQTINYRSKYPQKWDTVKTMDIKDNLYNYRGDYQYSIPMVEPVHFYKQEVPLAPYLLGALLGDGGLSGESVYFSNPEKDIQERIKSLLPEGVSLINKGDDELNFRVSIGNIGGKSNPITAALRELGLMGTLSNSKFIPDVYKFNTPDVRQEVLCGLIDTDGYIKTDKGEKQGCTVQYTTVSKQLCDDVKFLVQSFGGTVIINSKYPSFTHKGEKKTGQLAYTLSIRLPKGILPVSSKKQLEKFVEKTKYQPIRFIQAIEDIGMHEAQCIRVEAEDHLYVCDEFIVTHNTPSAIFTICQFLATGYAKRPLLVVPNQTYKQWISEFKKFANHIRINEFYNLSADYIDDWKDVNGVTKMVAEGSVSIITYEGMKQIGFKKETTDELAPEIASILMQENKGEITAKKADREAEKLNSKVEEIIGKALSKSIINIEELGFDFISFDEAHACKKVFTFVKGEKEENLGNSGKDTKSISRYEIKSGEPSFNGVKGFMLCHYIQKKYQGNTLLLTATPFTNSPLEVYSMLAMVAHKKLKEMALDNLATFFDTFVAISYEMIINSRLKPERRQVILGFNNLISLQTLVRRFINYKTGEEVKVPRPNKIVLPLRTKMINGLMVNLSDEEKVETILPLTEIQNNLMNKIKEYADGQITEGAMCSGSLVEEEENEDAAVAAGVEIDEDAMDADEKVGVRLLKAMNHARNLALSPYIFECSGLGEPTAEKYINTSNKLRFVMESIRTIKKYHEKEGTDMSGVVIYMDRGVQYFKLIREYLIKNLGFAEHEVGIISSKLIVPVPSGTPKDEQKEYVKNLFLGDRFNKDTLEMEKLAPSERCKVLIGSSTIKEGINLQKHSSVLFNCWMDWNPTDIQQLEGRIYRQGNKFKTVRIVNPLMIDSMDIFMFQKLEEKTSRINTIWQNDGRTNVLKTEEFNPKDLKYSLIKDATVLAQMELMEVGEKIEEDIADLENQIKRNKKIIGYDQTITSKTEDLAEWLEEYRPLSEGQPKRPLEAMLRLAQEVLKYQI